MFPSQLSHVLESSLFIGFQLLHEPSISNLSEDQEKPSKAHRTSSELGNTELISTELHCSMIKTDTQLFCIPKIYKPQVPLSALGSEEKEELHS